MKTIDNLIYDWEQAILNKEYESADKIRNYLDTKHVFCFTSVDGPLIFHRKSGTREDMIKKIQQDSRSNRVFDSWLYTIKAKHPEHFSYD